MTNIYVGLMSGTSLDGISAAVVRFSPTNGMQLDAELLGFITTEYTPGQRSRLLNAMQQGSAKEYCRLAVDLGEWLSTAATVAIAESGVAKADIRAIGSHGQTLWHEPGHSTWQLDAPAVIAEQTGLPVVSDFRVRDVAAGGQGAPLVPIADALLFSSNKWRALQNVGGIGNVTVVPPNATSTSVRAFDTGPGVTVIDAVVRTLFTGLRFDKDGLIAASGKVIDAVVDEMMRHPFFAAEPPKSTGRELFTPLYVEAFMERCQALGATCDADVVATATAFTAATIADAYRRFIPEPMEEVLVSGGGAKNPVLMSMITSRCSPQYCHSEPYIADAPQDMLREGPAFSVLPFDKLYFDGEAKEAVAFALLAHLHVSGLPGNVPSATGARGPRILGNYTPA